MAIKNQKNTDTMAWYLGFDCATKTFAYSLCRIDLSMASLSALRRQASAAAELIRRVQAQLAQPKADLAASAERIAQIREIVRRLDTATRALIHIADGGVADLCPGRNSQGVSTVDRVRATASYVRSRVLPSVRRHAAGAPLRVVIEHQMGFNAPARVVAVVLATLFEGEDVMLVGPTLKNTVSTCSAGRYECFAERYASAYSANKAHSAYNFARIEEAFGTNIPATSPLSLRGHIADSFMQVLGLLVNGAPLDKARTMF